MTSVPSGFLRAFGIWNPWSVHLRAIRYALYFSHGSQRDNTHLWGEGREGADHSFCGWLIRKSRTWTIFRQAYVFGRSVFFFSNKLKLHLIPCPLLSASTLSVQLEFGSEWIQAAIARKSSRKIQLQIQLAGSNFCAVFREPWKKIYSRKNISRKYELHFWSLKNIKHRPNVHQVVPRSVISLLRPISDQSTTAGGKKMLRLYRGTR